MALVHHVTKVHRTIFRKLPFGGVYHTTGVAPIIKATRRGVITISNLGSGIPTTTDLSDTSVAVKVVPRQWTKLRSL